MSIQEQQPQGQGSQEGPSHHKPQQELESKFDDKIIEHINILDLLMRYGFKAPVIFASLKLGLASKASEEVMAMFPEAPDYVQVALAMGFMPIHLVGEKALINAFSSATERGALAIELGPMIGNTTGAEGEEWRSAHNTTRDALGIPQVEKFMVVANEKMNAAVARWVEMLKNGQKVSILPHVQEVFLNIVPDTLVTIPMSDTLKSRLAWSIREALISEILLRKRFGHPTFLQSLEQAFEPIPGLEVIEGLNETHRELSTLVVDVVFQTINASEPVDLGLASKYLELYLKENNLTIEDLKSAFEGVESKEELKKFLLSPEFKQNPKHENIIKALTSLMAELRGIYNAAFETTSSVMSSLVWYLAQDPEYYAEVRKEVMAFYEKHGDEAIPNHTQLRKEFPFAVAAVLSATNLQPPLGAQARVVTKPKTIEGKQPSGADYKIDLEEGENVIFYLRGANRKKHPSWMPSDYLEQNEKGIVGLNVESFKDFALNETTSFSADRHFCLGFELALAEEMLFLCAIARAIPKLEISKHRGKTTSEPPMKRGITDGLDSAVSILPSSLK